MYALDPVSVGAPAVIAARLRGKKFMLRLGGDYAWEQGRVRFGVSDTLDDYTEKRNEVPWQVRVLAFIQATVVRQAAVVVAPSAYLKSIIATWGSKAERIRVVYSSLSPLTPALDKNEVRRKYNVTDTVLVTSGRLVPWKGIATLVDVVAKLKDLHPNITLLIAGDGPDRQQLEEKIESLGLTHHVYLLGRLSKSELANVKNAADVFVLNTAYEGLSHELLEVMDLGVPIVTTTAGGNTELLQDKKDALLVPFDDAEQLQESINSILANPEMATRLTESARLRTSEFSEDKVVQQLDLLLHNVYEA